MVAIVRDINDVNRESITAIDNSVNDGQVNRD